MDSSKSSTFKLIDLDPEVTEKVLLAFLKEKTLNIKKIEFSNQGKDNLRSADVEYESTIDTQAILEDITDEKIPGTKSSIVFDFEKLIHQTSSGEQKFTLHTTTPTKIKYGYDYYRAVHTDYSMKQGDYELYFTNQKILDKQRGVMGYFLKKVGSNLFSGKSIMNISLPINLFDERSLLELFAHQHALAPFFLEKAGREEFGIEKMKLTTTFALATLHTRVTMLKPFNPILGETFQAKIGNTHIYIEQTSHHPPIYNFLYKGEDFTAYGYDESQAYMGANSVTANNIGSWCIKYSDGTIHKIIPPTILVTGLTYGNRTFAVTDKLFIVDEQNDFLTYIEFNPDDRSSLSKLWSKKSSYPDYFKGEITRLSQATFNKKTNSYTKTKDSFTYVKVEGEWTKQISFDDTIYWDFETFMHYDLERMEYTIPSDSTFRIDCIALKNGDENLAQENKTKLEEIQRNDRELRKKHHSK